jgi:hypothetical protein
MSPSAFGLKKALERNTRTYRSFWPRELATAFAEQGFDVGRECKQFVLPMVMHRMLRGATILQRSEDWLRSVGVTGLIGSPVIVRMDRREG